MKKQHSFSLKSFVKDLKALVKPHYLSAMWPVGGVTIIYFALICILSQFMANTLQSLLMSYQFAMMGMVSFLVVGFALAEFLLVFILIIALAFFYNFYTVAVQYTYQDHLAHPDQPVSAGSIWMHFKHLRKNQLWRLALYIGLFITLWSLPLSIAANIVGSLTHNGYWLLGIQLVNELVIIWKSIEYSQAYFLYRERQPKFLGQSMRHALTASRRFMGGRKWNYFLAILFTVVLPILFWSVIFGGLAYYGNYTATYVLLYIGLIIMIIGLVCYLPVVFAVGTLFYDNGKKDATTDIDEDFKDTFKPVAVLTGEAFVHEVYQPKKDKEQPTPAVKPEKGKKKREAKKDD